MNSLAKLAKSMIKTFFRFLKFFDASVRGCPLTTLVKRGEGGVNQKLTFTNKEEGGSQGRTNH